MPTPAPAARRLRGPAGHYHAPMTTLDLLMLLAVLYLGLGAGFAVGWTAYGHGVVEPHTLAHPLSRRLWQFPRALVFWPVLWWRWVGQVFRRR